MSTPPSPSVDKFDVLKSEILEQRKSLKRVMEKLDRDAEMVERLRMEKEKAQQLYECSVRELEKTASKVKAVLEPMKVDNNLKFTNPPNPTFSVKVEKKEVGESSGTKEANGSIHNPDVAEVDQSKEPRVRGNFLLSRRCDLKIIDNITKHLERESLEGFKASCFGRLLEIKQLDCQGQLLLHLLWSINMDASNKEKKLVFNINYSNIEFGPTEFSQITGLRIGKCDGTIRPSLSSSSSIHKKVFKGRLKILLNDVKQAFLCHKGKGELTLKLALLYFLYGTLLAGNNDKRINLRFVDLIEDLHKFNEFRWGQVAYEFLVSSFLSTRAIMDNCSELQKPSFLLICGFSVALQVWAYELIPALAEHCAVRLNISENLTPSILHWSTQKKVVRFNDLRIFFTPGDEAHLEDVRTDTNGQSERGKDTAEDDTVIISDTDDDDDLVSRRPNKKNRRDLGETRNTTADARSMDSDVDSAHIDELVAACASK